MAGKEQRIETDGPSWGVSRRDEGRRILIFSAIDYLPRADLVPFTLRLVKGETFDFSSALPFHSWRTLLKTGSQFRRIFATILDDPRLDESRQACSILSSDLGRFPQDRSLFRDADLLKEWIFKLNMGVFLHYIFGERLALERDLVDTEIGGYYKEIDAQVENLGKILSSLEVGDLPLYIRFEDIFYFYGTYSLFRYKTTNLPRHPEEGVNKVLFGVREREDALRGSLLDENTRTWERLRLGWQAKQLEDTLLLLPSIGSHLVRENVLAAFEVNLSNLLQEGKTVYKEGLPKEQEGIIDLLKWRWQEVLSHYRHTAYSQIYLDNIFGGAQEMQSYLETNVEFPDFSVPRKYLPTAAIALLSHLTKREGSLEFLQEISKEVMVNKDAVVPWFLTLLVLKSHDSSISDVVKEQVNKLENLPQAVREVFLNNRSGKVWLMQDGRLRVTDVKTNLTSAFPVFTSSQTEDSLKEEVTQVTASAQEGKVTQEKKHVEIENTFHMPFYGEVGQVDKPDIKALISEMFQVCNFNEDHLLEEYGRLSNEWKKRTSSDREFLYICELDLSEEYAKKAKNVGIEALHIKGQDIIVVLGETPTRVGLLGRLDKEGQLRLEGMDDSFIGERDHLFLNTLVLHFVVQPFYRYTGLVGNENSERAIVKEINRVAASWNRSLLRGALPKIERTGRPPYIAVRIPSVKEFFLVGEK